jgi:hypothetical protein
MIIKTILKQAKHMLAQTNREIFLNLFHWSNLFQGNHFSHTFLGLGFLFFSHSHFYRRCEGLAGTTAILCCELRDLADFHFVKFVVFRLSSWIVREKQEQQQTPQITQITQTILQLALRLLVHAMVVITVIEASGKVVICGWGHH